MVIVASKLELKIGGIIQGIYDPSGRASDVAGLVIRESTWEEWKQCLESFDTTHNESIYGLVKYKCPYFYEVSVD